MERIISKTVISKIPNYLFPIAHNVLCSRAFYSAGLKNDKHSKFLKRLKNIPSQLPKDDVKNFKYHPVAVVGVLTLLYSLYTALQKKEKDESYTSDLKEEIKQSSANLKKRNVKIIFVIGGPSSGKSTLCRQLADKLDAVHLSASSLLEKELNLPFSPHSLTIANCIKNGVPVPTNLLTSIFWIAINEADKTTFLIDGFPKKMDQAIRFQESILEPSAVIEIECPFEDMLSRFSVSSGKSLEESTDVIKTRNDSIRDSSFRVANYYSKSGKLLKVSCLHAEELLAEHVVYLLKNKS